METGFSSFSQVNFDELLIRLHAQLPSLPRQEARLAQYISLNQSSLGLETGKSLAEKVGVPEVTVGRLLRRLGCDGMKGLKQLLREHYSVAASPLSATSGVPEKHASVHEAEVQALSGVFAQMQGKTWETIVSVLSNSETVFATGFQSVRGLVEDFARRLALARPDVHYLSPHDGMLGEWLDVDDGQASRTCLVLVDVVPYAAESQKLARIAKAQGRSVIIVSDEYCHWSTELADAAIFAPSRTGMFLESTVGVVAALSLMVDCAAKANEMRAAQRLIHWKTNSRRMGLF